MPKTSAWPLALIYTALIVFASLFPFDGWRAQGIDPLVFLLAPLPPPYWTGFDIATNVVGYAPLGFLLVLAMLRSGWGRWSWCLVLGLPALLSLAVETLQNYLPMRVPSNIDFALNAAGAAAGHRLGIDPGLVQIKPRPHVQDYHVPTQRWSATMDQTPTPSINRDKLFADAKVIPIVLLTSNSTRDLGDALKRRCLHLHIGFPDEKLEARIIASRVPGIDARLLKQLVSFVQQLRSLDLKKLPSVSETIDWAKCLLALDVITLSPEVIADTLGAILKYQDDIQKIQGSEAKKLLEEAGWVDSDGDGVVVIEREKAPAMLALADKKVADEAARLDAIARGDTASKWLPAALRAAGVLQEGETL